MTHSGWVAAGRMGKFPVRLKEVIYTISPFEVSVLSGLWKDLPEKLSRKFREVRAAVAAVALPGRRLVCSRVVEARWLLIELRGSVLAGSVAMYIH